MNHLFGLAPLIEVWQQPFGEHAVEDPLRNTMPMLLHTVVPGAIAIVGIVNVILIGIFGLPLATAFPCRSLISFSDQVSLEH